MFFSANLNVSVQTRTPSQVVSRCHSQPRKSSVSRRPHEPVGVHVADHGSEGRPVRERHQIPGQVMLDQRGDDADLLILRQPFLCPARRRAARIRRASVLHGAAGPGQELAADVPLPRHERGFVAEPDRVRAAGPADGDRLRRLVVRQGLIGDGELGFVILRVERLGGVEFDMLGPHRRDLDAADRETGQAGEGRRRRDDDVVAGDIRRRHQAGEEGVAVGPAHLKTASTLPPLRSKLAARVEGRTSYFEAGKIGMRTG